VRRFIRSIHPCNIFLMPQNDWRRHGADPDLIGNYSPGVIAPRGGS
jgi:hypothetical protein